MRRVLTLLWLAVDLAGASRVDSAETWAESAVRFLTHAWVSSLLMAIAMLGIPGAAGMLALTLFFWGHWLVALAGWEERLLVTLGLLLLLVEALVLPGFGIAGVLGLVALVTGVEQEPAPRPAEPAAFVATARPAPKPAPIPDRARQRPAVSPTLNSRRPPTRPDFSDRAALRRTVVAMTLLGPCRALEREQA